MRAGFLMATDDVPDKPVALAKIRQDGVLVVRMRFIISAGEIDAGYFQPVPFQCRHIRSQPLCRLVTVPPGIYCRNELIGAEPHSVDLCHHVPVPFPVALDDETAVGKEGHVGMAAAYASYLLLYEEGAFHRFEILQAFQADPDAVLVIRADSGHPFTLAVIADNHRVRHKMGCIGACLAPVYLVHVRHDTGVAFPVAFDRVDVSVPVLPERNTHPPEFPDDEPGYLPLLAGGGGDVVK